MASNTEPTALEEYHQQMKEYYAARVDTDQPVETGDRVEMTQLSGLPHIDYPVEGEVVRVEPRGMGTHNIFADWFIKVRFTEDELDGAVYKGTTELVCVGGTRREWEDLPVKQVE